MKSQQFAHLVLSSIFFLFFFSISILNFASFFCVFRLMLEADADADAAGWLEKQVLPGLRGSRLIHIIVANFVVVVVVCLYLIAKNYNSVKFIMKIIIMHVLFVVVVVVAVPLYGRGLSKCAYLKIQFLCRNNGRGLADLAL